MDPARAFDPHARLIACNAASLVELRRQFGSVGLRNGPRTGQRRRTTTSNEAYLVRRLVLDLASKHKLMFPITVEHGDGPDFVILHGSQRMPLEATEACPAEEGRASALQGDEMVPVGNYSETGSQQAMIDLRDQLQAAIDRKRQKLYAAEENASLLVYPNSDASLWVRLFRRRQSLPFLRLLQIAPLTTLYVFWSDTRFFVHKGEAK